MGTSAGSIPWDGPDNKLAALLSREYKHLPCNHVPRYPLPGPGIRDLVT